MLEFDSLNIAHVKIFSLEYSPPDDSIENIAQIRILPPLAKNFVSLACYVPQSLGDTIVIIHGMLGDCFDAWMEMILKKHYPVVHIYTDQYASALITYRNSLEFFEGEQKEYVYNTNLELFDQLSPLTFCLSDGSMIKRLSKKEARELLDSLKQNE